LKTTVPSSAVNDAVVAAVAPKVGRYLLLRQLGTGAMGVVHEAYDPKLERKVAIKVLRPSPSGKDLDRRLLREAKAAARLSHPNVVAIYDVGETASALFVAMELVDGVTLRSWLQERRRV
jgi:eukaryotic-like serine/threonine-protein kinase